MMNNKFRSVVNLRSLDETLILAHRTINLVLVTFFSSTPILCPSRRVVIQLNLFMYLGELFLSHFRGT